ncbi:MAG: CRISPR-associated endonuclease Cas1 [Deltaproteobacteria bacterium]|nr:CRISPR-associated endonuclease Cas1 [Deltaproteobacteria bacterium]
MGDKVQEAGPAGKVVQLGGRAQEVEKTIPAQYDLFTGEPKPLPIIVDRDLEEDLVVSDEISLVRSGDAAQIILSGFGLFLSKKSDRLIVKKGKDLIYEFPFFRLSEVTVASRGITLSSDLIMELCARGIHINFLHGNGRPFAKLTSPMLSATIQARREQFLALDDERGAEFSRLIVLGKLNNQRKLLLYFGKYLKKSTPERHKIIEEKAKLLGQGVKRVKALKGSSVENIRKELLGLEGSSSRVYWEGVQEIIADSFLHVDRPGKPSLVLDLVEEFRQPVVDRTVISHVNLGESIKMEGGLLDAETRKNLSQKVINRLETRETYQGKKYQIRSIIQIQARNLAAFLRGERNYKPFSFKW